MVAVYSASLLKPSQVRSGKEGYFLNLVGFWSLKEHRRYSAVFLAVTILAWMHTPQIPRFDLAVISHHCSLMAICIITVPKTNSNTRMTVKPLILSWAENSLGLKKLSAETGK